jgi:membrane protein DedA with SNARE-associated domain
MPHLTSAVGHLGEFAVQVISSGGYFGVFFLMVLESMIIPMPSELVMPFAGFVAGQGKFNFFLVVLSSSLGSLAGSLLSYWMGYYGGNKFVIHFGKYLLLDVADLKKTEDWFAQKGEKTIFFSRFIPVVRHLISIPAGIGKMKLGHFSFYTVFGATLWNTFLAYLGYVLGENWEEVRHYSHYLSLGAAVLLGLGSVYFVIHHVKDRRKSAQLESELTR